MSAGTISRSFFDAAGRRYAPVAAAILFFGDEPVVNVSIGEGGTRQWSRGTHWRGEGGKERSESGAVFIQGI